MSHRVYPLDLNPKPSAILLPFIFQRRFPKFRGGNAFSSFRSLGVETVKGSSNRRNSGGDTVGGGRLRSAIFKLVAGHDVRLGCVEMPRDVLNERKHVAAAVEAKRNPPPALLAFFVFLNKNIQCLSQNRIGQNPFERRIFFSFSLFLLNFGLTFQIRNTKTGYGFCTEEEGEKKILWKN